MNVAFEEESHIYFETKTHAVVPSVTQILKAEGITKVWPGMTQYRQRGKNVHKAVELTHDDSLDVEGEVQRDKQRQWPIVPYVKQWLQCKAEHGIEPISWERLVSHGALYYAGRYDLVANYEGELAVLDIKSQKKLVTPSPAVRLQCAGYATADDGPGRVLRVAVCISPDGHAVERYEMDNGDYADWDGVVRTYHFKRRHKLSNT